MHQSTFSLFGFSIQQFFVCLFYCPKTAFVCEFQHTPFWKIIFSSMFHTSYVWVWDFVNIYLTHLETRIKCRTIHAYLKKLFFGPSKLCCPPLTWRKKTFLSTLKIMISQTVRNKYIRFGGHADIEISYKSLQLKILNEALIFLNSPCFY
jgi:hypothetical protein